MPTLELASDASLIRDQHYKGPTWPFLLLYGRKDSFRREINVLVTKLNADLRLGLL